MKLARALEEECPNILSGVKLVSKLDIPHAEERLHCLIRKWGMTIPVPIDACNKMLFKERLLLTQPMVKVTSWFQYLLDQHPELLLGGFKLGDQHTGRFLTAFWQAYQQEHPSHEIFRVHGGRLSQCVPYTLFGDEGRGLRKSPIMIMAMEAAFGRASYHSFQAALKKGVKVTDETLLACMAHTGRGSSLNSRFLLYALPHSLYRGKPRKSFWYDCFNKIPPDCQELFHKGVACQGRVFYGVCIGIKGDAPAQAKIGALTRSFAHLGHLKGMCAQCLAGTGLESPKYFAFGVRYTTLDPIAQSPSPTNCHVCAVLLS